MKKLIYVLIVLIILALVGYFVLNRLFPDSNQKSKNADFELKAEKLYRQFTNNEKLANVNYLDKTIKVSGKILEIEKDKKGDVVILLASHTPAGGVLGTLTTQSTTYKPGDNINIQGICTGILNDVILKNCIIVD